VATVAVVGLLVGLVLFPHGHVILLSGTSIGYAQALGRAGLICLYVLVMLAAVAAIGIAVSTFTEVPMAAMATVAVLTIVSEIADTLPQLSVVHRYLFTDPWLDFGDLLRAPISWAGIEHGVLVAVIYIALALSLAWARLTTKDVNT
jgi:ABC-2 type transport system permease protein